MKPVRFLYLSYPNCGALMNRHAEKSIKDPDVPEGEVIASIHYCPKCGTVEAKFQQQDR